jgi:hypothetical protein
MPKRSCKSLANKLYRAQAMISVAAAIHATVHLIVSPASSAKLSSNPVQRYAAHRIDCRIDTQDHLRQRPG